MSGGVLAALDDELKILQCRVEKYRRKADRKARRDGKRCDGADRQVIWAAERLDGATATRAKVAELLAADAAYDEARSIHNHAFLHGEHSDLMAQGRATAALREARQRRDAALLAAWSNDA